MSMLTCHLGTSDGACGRLGTPCKQCLVVETCKPGERDGGYCRCKEGCESGCCDPTSGGCQPGTADLACGYYGVVIDPLELLHAPITSTTLTNHKNVSS